MSDSTQTILFPSVKGKEVVARFDGGDITSDGGLLLVSESDARIGLTASLSSAIEDKRQRGKVEHSLASVLSARVYAIAAGYEDANDLTRLRSDPALKMACGRAPKSARDLAGQSTVSRFENSVTKKDLLRMGYALAGAVVKQLPPDTRRVVLDLDAMEDPCHGQQQFELFNKFYDSHCYLPLLLFVTDERGRQRLMSVLLRSGKPGGEGVSGLLKRAVGLLRRRFPGIAIELRADAGFGNDSTLRLCDQLQIDYTLGLASNRRLQTLSTPAQMRACCKYTFEKASWSEAGVCREFDTFEYKAGSWDKKRTVVVKAEVTRGTLNPRFVVTSRVVDEAAEAEAEAVYAFYCERGDRENRIKEFKLDLCGGRTSCHHFLANQCRVILHAAAAVLMSVLQEAARETAWASSQAQTIRLRLLKVGARVVESTRRIWLHLSSAFPEQAAWRRIHAALTG